jgi:hypothetical protein
MEEAAAMFGGKTFSSDETSCRSCVVRGFFLRPTNSLNEEIADDKRFFV